MKILAEKEISKRILKRMAFGSYSFIVLLLLLNAKYLTQSTYFTRSEHKIFAIAMSQANQFTIFTTVRHASLLNLS